jgi:glycosyltransferase involved in cell wall biosynthesis
MIVMDDGSTDATPDLLAAMAARDSRLHVIRQPNLGLTRALIRC